MKREATISVRVSGELLEGMERTKVFLHAFLSERGLRLEGPVIPTDSDFVRIAIQELIATLSANKRLHIQPALFPNEPPPPAREKTSAPKRTGAIPWPFDFVLTPQRREYALEHLGCSAQEVDDLWAQFAAHHTARGSLFHVWPKAWITWVLNEKRMKVRFGRIRPNKHEKAATFEERMAAAKSRLYNPR